MAEDESPKGPFAAIGAGLLALFGGLATVADDCGRAAVGLGAVADDAGRAAVHADDLGALAAREAALAAQADDLGRTGALGGALDDAARAADDGASELAADLAEVGIDVTDLALNAVADAPAAPDTPPPSPRPRLLVARAANPPATAPFDPLVLLVDEPDATRLQGLAKGCATVEHRCVVIACPPARAACFDHWRGIFEGVAADPELGGHPEAVADALWIGGRTVRAAAGTRLYTAVVTPTGVVVDQRR